MSRDSKSHTVRQPTETRMGITPPHSSQTPSAAVFLSVLLQKVKGRTDFSPSAPPINMPGFLQWQGNVFPFFENLEHLEKDFLKHTNKSSKINNIIILHASFHEYSVNYNQMDSCLLRFKICDIYLNSHPYLFLLFLLINKTVIKTTQWTKNNKPQVYKSCTRLTLSHHCISQICLSVLASQIKRNGTYIQWNISQS